MVLLALAFVAGALGLQQLPHLPAPHWAAVLLPLLLFSLLWCDRFFGRLNLALLVCGAGFFWAAAHAHVRLADELPQAWEGRDIQLIGVVATMPQQQERGERFEFDVEQVLTAGAQVPAHVSLTWYAEYASSPPHNATRFHAGERWQLTVRLKRPHGTLNPYGFDFEAWALENNIRATGYVRKDTENRLVDALVPRPAYLVEAAREKIRQRMQTVLAQQRYGGVLQALAIGDEAAIPQPDWQTFLHTGTNHLMSISGLHITMLAGLGFALVHVLWRRSEKLALALPARKAATLAGVLIGLAYALIAGFSVPAQRTFFMLLVIALAFWSGRNVSIARVLALALLAVVVLDPWAVLAPGFWLSFGAVAVIAYALGGRLQRPHWLREAIQVQWAVSLGLVPLLLVLFHQVSIISPLANAIAIPLVSLVVVPLTLAGSLLPLSWLLGLAHEVMEACMAGLQWLAALPLSTWQQHAPPAWTLPLALVGVCWMLLPRGFPMRWLGLIALMPMLLLKPAPLSPGAMQVAVLDVGQGLAVVVQTATHTLLYDTGPRFSAQSDSGARIVVPFLQGQGIRRLDTMVVSHHDNDHAGGMASVLAQMPVSRVMSSLPAESLGMAKAKHTSCVAGQSWTWDGVRFDMLYPAAGSYQKRIKDNDRSCVLRVSTRYGSLLLPGDIERRAERDLMRSMRISASDVLVVPHHGSKTSSTMEFIEQVRPQVAIFTVGYRNRFGHPKPGIIKRYQHAGSQLYRTDRDGALLMDFSGMRTVAVRRWRAEARRYWHDAGPDAAGLLAEIGAAR
jgi:competence protein ComEC